MQSNDAEPTAIDPNLLSKSDAPPNEWVMLYTSSSPIDIYTTIHLGDASNGSIVLTLPDITGAQGVAYDFKRIDFNETNTVTLVGSLGQPLEGQASYILSVKDSVSFVSFNGGWYASDKKDALAVTYTPKTSTEWSPQPKSVREAIDQVGQVVGTLSVRILQGTGSPEGVIVGSPGFMYINTAGGSGAILWVKETGTLTNTGWAAVSTTPADTNMVVSANATSIEETPAKRWYFF